MAKIKVTYDDGSTAEWEATENQIADLQYSAQTTVELGESEYRGPSWTPWGVTSLT